MARMTTTVALIAFAAASAAAFAQTKSLRLDTAAGLTLHNTRAEAVSLKGKKAVRLTSSLPAPAAAEAKAGGKKGGSKKGGTPAGEAARADHLAIVDGLTFGNGTIEVDLAGEPGPGAAAAARGFTGVAFRVQPDRKTYDCFYLRPTNGRAEDQERRNHTVQYISHPAFPWFRLREETPSRYESYADIGPGEWIHVRIDISGDKGRLFVNKSAQPALIVNDIKSGATATGSVALWFEGSTVAHFANLKITPR